MKYTIMKTDYLLPLIGIIILVSCNNPKPSKSIDIKTQKTIEPPYIIDLEKNLNKTKSVLISNIGKKLEYIPLETTPKSLIKRIYEIRFSGPYIFINDMEKILQFSKDGKFVRQVGANGRGPGEYIHVISFCIDEIQKRIMIIAWGMSYILEFDFDGHYIRTFKTAFLSPSQSIGQILVRDTNSIVCRIGNVPNRTKDPSFSLIITDMQGIPNIKIKIKNNLKRESKSGLVIGITPLYFFNNKVHFLEFGIDTLSILKDSILEPYAIFNLGKMKMDPDPSIIGTEILERLKQKLWIRDILENEHNLFVRLDFGLSDSLKLCVYKKQTDETIFLEDNGFLNDVDGGLTFWPKYVYNDSILIDYKEGYVFKKQINSGNQEEKMKKYGDKYIRLKKLANAVDELSNPVLIILK